MRNRYYIYNGSTIVKEKEREFLKKVAIYIRVSTKEQVGEDKFGLAVQLEMCKEHCKKNGFIIYYIYEDDGKPGGYDDLDNDLNKRPALNKLFEDAAKMPLFLILCYRNQQKQASKSVSKPAFIYTHAISLT